MIVGTQRPAPRRPTGSVVEPPRLGLPRDPSEARTQLDPRAGSIVSAKARAPTTPPPPDATSAKLLVIASMMSLVVVVLSIAVLTKTTGDVNIQTDAPVQIQTIAPKNPAPAAPAAPASKDPKADLMLTLDVEPKDASLVVQPTSQGFQVKVAANGYQPETRTIEKGVTGKIAVKLEPAPKKAVVKKKKPAPKKRKKVVAKKGPKSDAEVFLTGSDL